MNPLSSSLFKGLHQRFLGLHPGLRKGVARQRSVTDCLGEMAPAVWESLSPEQCAEVERIVDLALPKPAPKLVDLRVDVDLLFDRYFIVLFVGRDRRRRARQHQVSPATALGNWMAAVVLLLGMNLAVTVCIGVLAYLLKSAVGIDLLPGHFRGFAE